jgi:hypothetical protein
MPFNLIYFFPITSHSLNKIILPLATIMAITSYLRRNKAIGGWLLYFYYWICVFLFLFLADVAQHPAAYFSNALKPDIHVALIMAAVPRLLASGTMVIVAFLLLKTREWIWVERLRLCMIITSLCAGISVVIDHYYFPRSTFTNGVRLIGLSMWTLYFLVSMRVNDVFRTKTSEAEHESGEPTSLQLPGATERSEGEGDEN